MRSIRLLFYLCIGLLIGANFSLAFADTPQLSGGCGWFQRTDSRGSVESCTTGSSWTGYSLCSYSTSEHTIQPQVFWPYVNYKYCNPGSICDNVHNTCVSSCPAGTELFEGKCVSPCPNGRNPDGSCLTSCPNYGSAPADSLPLAAPAGCTCPAGSKWYPYNGCRKECATPTNQLIGGGWLYDTPKDGVTCAQGCVATANGDTYARKGQTSFFGQLISTGWACGAGAPASTVPPDNTTKTVDNTKVHEPKCGAGEGVLTSSSGTVACVPSGTPDARSPQIESKKKVERFPDNSTKTTDTTITRDPYTGAEHESVTTTSTGGQSGAAGTTTSSGNSSTGADGQGGDEKGQKGQCELEPNSPMCKKGTLKEPGQFPDANPELEAAKGELRAKFAEVKAQITQMFSGSLAGGAGGLPCSGGVDVLGKRISFCMSNYESSLSGVGAAVLFIAALASLFIVLRR